MTAAVAGAGVAFAARLLVPAFVSRGHIGFSALPDIDPERLANAPTVLFAGILLLSAAGLIAARAGFQAARWGRALLLAGGGMLCLLAMAAVTQRASLGLGLACLAVLWVMLLAHRPARALRALIVPAIIAVALYPQFAALAHQLWQKTTLVGLNNRPQEASVVFAAVGGRWMDALFGLGWGQTIVSPAAGDITINYTHTMTTAYWLKTGIIGAALVWLYLGGIALRLWPVLWRHPGLALAVAAPCLIDAILYASYKSLDFGLMLALVPLWASEAEMLRPLRRLVYSETSAANHETA